MTPGDRVRRMSNEELALFIVKMMTIVEGRTFNKKSFYSTILSELNKERDERINDHSGLDV